MDPFAFENFCGDFQIAQAPVGAAADKRLIDFDIVGNCLAEAVPVGRKKRVGDDRFERIDVDFEGFGVDGVVVAVMNLRFACERFVGEKRFGDLIDGDDAAFGTRFDRHIAHAETVVHTQMRDGIAGEFEGTVKRPVDADAADDFEDDVLAGRKRTGFAVQDDLDRFRDFEPVAAGHHRERKVGRAHAGAERSECAVGTGVAVGADNDVAGDDKPFFGQQGMLDPHIFFVEKVLHAVFLGKITADARLIGRCDVFGGNEVVEHNAKAVGIGKLGRTALFERADGDGRGDVVADDHVDRYADDFARMHGAARMFGKNFFGNGLTHGICLWCPDAVPGKTFARLYHYSLPSLSFRLWYTSRKFPHTCRDNLYHRRKTV